MFTFYTKLLIWSFHVVIVDRTTKKCSKKYNARAESLFCQLKLVSRRRRVCVSYTAQPT